MSKVAIFIINLPASTDRRDFMQNQLASISTEFTFIEAVDGSKFDNAELSTVKKEVSYAITKGEVGCALSHLKAYETLVKSDYDMALILEDDVIIPSDIDMHLSRLHENNNSKRATITLLSEVYKYYEKNSFSTDENHHVHKVVDATFAHGYVINKLAAERLLKKLYPVWCVADQWTTFKEFGFVDIYAVIPFLINTHDVFEKKTTIENRKLDNVQEEKKRMWNEIKKSRPLKVKIRRSLWLAFVRHFVSIKNSTDE